MKDCLPVVDLMVLYYFGMLGMYRRLEDSSVIECLLGMCYRPGLDPQHVRSNTHKKIFLCGVKEAIYSASEIWTRHGRDGLSMLCCLRPPLGKFQWLGARKG